MMFGNPYEGAGNQAPPGFGWMAPHLVAMQVATGKLMMAMCPFMPYGWHRVDPSNHSAPFQLPSHTNPGSDSYIPPAVLELPSTTSTAGLGTVKHCQGLRYLPLYL